MLCNYYCYLGVRKSNCMAMKKLFVGIVVQILTIYTVEVSVFQISKWSRNIELQLRTYVLLLLEKN